MARKKAEPKFRAGMKIWVASRSAEGVFGEGKFNLLKAVDKTGSLNKATKIVSISYRKAWGDIQKAEKRLGRKLLTRERGGKGGGNSVLTPFACQLMDAYEEFRDEVKSYANKQFNLKLKKYFK